MSRNESVLSVLSESGIYVLGLVNHRLMSILLDTSATVSVLSEMAMSGLFWEKMKCEFVWERLNAPGLLQ